MKYKYMDDSGSIYSFSKREVLDLAALYITGLMPGRLMTHEEQDDFRWKHAKYHIVLENGKGLARYLPKWKHHINDFFRILSNRVNNIIYDS